MKTPRIEQDKFRPHIIRIRDDRGGFLCSIDIKAGVVSIRSKRDKDYYGLNLKKVIEEFK